MVLVFSLCISTRHQSERIHLIFKVVAATFLQFHLILCSQNSAGLPITNAIISALMMLCRVVVI
jgi:hypothetical protein